jgi:hypothetical protein
MADEYVEMLKRLYAGGALSSHEMFKAIADHKNAKRLVVLAIFSAITGAASALISMTATVLTYKSFITNQRAYMSYDGVNFAKDEISPGGLRYSVSPKVSNTGNTPTKDLKMKVSCWLDPEAEAEPFDTFRAQKIEWQNGFYGPRATLQAIEFSYSLDQARAIKDGKLHSYMAADIRYKDFVDPRAPDRVTQIVLEFAIYSLDEKGGALIGGTGQRGKHNCADEGCPNEESRQR